MSCDTSAMANMICEKIFLKGFGCIKKEYAAHSMICMQKIGPTHLLKTNKIRDIRKGKIL